jgi:ABC-type molybdate transport system permease subunit
VFRVTMLHALLALLPAVTGSQLVAHPELTPTGMLAFTALVFAGLALAFLAHGARIAAAVTARPLSGRACALREKSRGAVFQRLLNPDAAGRIRPRAPSAAPAAA